MYVYCICKCTGVQLIFAYIFANDFSHCSITKDVFYCQELF